MSASSSVSSSLEGCTLHLPYSQVSLQLQSVLGTGSFGTVYCAVNPLNGEKFAVKHIHGSQALTAAQRSYQRQEIHHHSIVADHPNVVTLYDAVKVADEPGFFIVMELCTQPDLFDFTADQLVDRLADPDTVLKRIFAEVCDAVDYCHEKGIYHRDLKPENIMLTTEKDGTLGARLGDFGLSAKRGHPSALTRGCGSVTYMSPETYIENWFQLPYDPVKSDVWALGILLCHLVAGLSPWRKASPSDPGFSFHLRYPKTGLQKLLQFSPELTSILTRVFQLKPKDRISVSELKDSVLALDSLRVKKFIPVEQVLSPPPQMADIASPDELMQDCPPTPAMDELVFKQNNQYDDTAMFNELEDDTDEKMTENNIIQSQTSNGWDWGLFPP